MRTLIQRRATPARRLAALFLTIVAVALTACGSTATIRDAQDEFSSAARLDNASGLRTGEMPSVQPSTGELGSALAASRAAARSYERSRELLTSVIASDEDSLRQDRLLAHALTLKAMCEWRLGEWDAAQATAEKALPESSAAQGPRDHALLIAMPGLIRNDQAFAMIQRWNAAGKVTRNEVAAARDLLVGKEVGAVAHLAKARESAGEHPVAIYLIQSELAAFKNLNDVMDAGGRFGVPTGEFDEWDAWTKEIQALLDELKRRSPPGASTDAMVKQWKDAFGL